MVHFTISRVAIPERKEAEIQMANYCVKKLLGQNVERKMLNFQQGNKRKQF
jgi:hypothetical protein